MIHAVSTSS